MKGHYGPWDMPNKMQCPLCQKVYKTTVKRAGTIKDINSSNLLIVCPTCYASYRKWFKDSLEGI